MSENANALAQDWSRDELSYACPPMAMVGRVLSLVAQQRTRAVIVLPEWPHQSWWPSLQAMAVKWCPLGEASETFDEGPWKPSNFQEPRVAILGGRGRRKAITAELSETELKQAKAEFIASAIEPATLRQYSSQIEHYKVFCGARKLPLYPVDMVVVEDCTVALMYANFSSVAVNMWSAICYFQEQRNFDRPKKSSVLRALHTKALKLAALSAQKLRDPIPLSAIRNFCEGRKTGEKEGIAAAALVTIVIRALLRCNELQKMRLEHVSMRDKLLMIDLGIRKNHKQRAAAIMVDPSGRSTCPVFLDAKAPSTETIRGGD
jgi:hypothetical protein